MRSPFSPQSTYGQTPRQETRTRLRQLTAGPMIAGYQVQHSAEQHLVAINRCVVSCTPDEYRLLMLLAEHYGQPVVFDELIAQFQDASPVDPALLKTARRKLTCTLSDLRAKLWPADFTIARVVDVGYLLIHQDKLWSLAHTDLSKTDDRL
jgi:DNA-binding response OmpR family regulator